MPRGTIARLAVAVGGGIVVLAAVVAAVVSLRRAPDPAVSGYNVLLITLDTTRADHLRCYGYGKETSPNLDALAADGVRFDCAISTSAVTPMAHASILTGLNPRQHGMRVFFGPVGHVLSKSHATLATILRERDWETGAFISSHTASQRFGLDQGFDTFDAEFGQDVMSVDITVRRAADGYWLRQPYASAQRRADATADRALKWLKKARRPFCLWVHYFDPHDPSLVPPVEITDRFGASPGMPDADKVVYDPEIFFMDMQLGRLLDHLKTSGEYDRTVIVIIGDHGQGLGDHGWFQHRLLYQEQIRVPLIVRLPGGERNRAVPDLVRNIDVLPTILDVLGFEPPEPVDGVSLCGLMKGQPEEPRIAFAEAFNVLDVHAPKDLPEHQRDLLFCAMDRTWKLIHHKNVPNNSELYRIEIDPAERINLAALYTDQRDRLRSMLEDSGAMTWETVEVTEPMSPEALEKLRSLGYVGGPTAPGEPREQD